MKPSSDCLLFRTDRLPDSLSRDARTEVAEPAEPTAALLDRGSILEEPATAAMLESVRPSIRHHFQENQSMRSPDLVEVSFESFLSNSLFCSSLTLASRCLLSSLLLWLDSEDGLGLGLGAAGAGAVKEKGLGPLRPSLIPSKEQVLKMALGRVG